MKKLILVMIMISLCLFSFILGVKIFNKTDDDILNSWSKIEGYFKELNVEKITSSTNIDSQDNVKKQINDIIDIYQMKKVEKINERKIIVKSYANLSQNNNQDSQYAVVRVNFDYTNSVDYKNNVFIYFYFYKISDSWRNSNWNLFDIRTENNVIVK